MEYLIAILFLYFIYKLHSKSKNKPKIYMRNVSFGKDIIFDESPRETYNPFNKDEVLKRAKKEFSDRDKFFGDNSFGGHDEETLENIEFAFDNPDSKERIIFHGGCLPCNSPKKNGLNKCIGCQYFTADWNLPDLMISN